MTIKDDLHEALKAAGLWMASSNMRIMSRDEDVLFIESAVIVKNEKGKPITAKFDGSPVPKVVAKCPCAEWTYMKDMGEWPKGGHHPNCDEGDDED